MVQRVLLIAAALATLLGLSACTDDDPTPTPAPTATPTPTPTPTPTGGAAADNDAAAASPVSSSSPVPLGDRVAAMAISDGVIGFERSYQLTRDFGFDATDLHLAWDEIEVAPGVYAPDPDFAAIADAFYGGEGVSLSVTLAAVDTTRDRRPADLRDLPFDDPEVIARFNGLIDWLATTLDTVTVRSVAIGNEVDVWLAFSGQWTAYDTFFEETADHARTAMPGVPVGTKTTLDGSRGSFGAEVARLHDTADVTMVTYYLIGDDFQALPPTAVHAAFADAVAIDPATPTRFMELGYPSHELLGGSEERQAEFVAEAFRAWDEWAGELDGVVFTWSSDIGLPAVETYYEYYGIADERFGAYLASIGYIDTDGNVKLAGEQLVLELEARQ